MTFGALVVGLLVAWPASAVIASVLVGRGLHQAEKTDHKGPDTVIDLVALEQASTPADADHLTSV